MKNKPTDTRELPSPDSIGEGKRVEYIDNHAGYRIVEDSRDSLLALLTQEKQAGVERNELSKEQIVELGRTLFKNLTEFAKKY